MGPIAVFDSGVGGLSVLRELVAQMPSEHFFYFGDSANAPYGTRPTAEIRSLTLAHAERLFDRGAKALVVACNTATSAAIGALRARWPDRVIIALSLRSSWPFRAIPAAASAYWPRRPRSARRNLLPCCSAAPRTAIF